MDNVRLLFSLITTITLFQKMRNLINHANAHSWIAHHCKGRYLSDKKQCFDWELTVNINGMKIDLIDCEYIFHLIKTDGGSCCQLYCILYCRRPNSQSIFEVLLLFERNYGTVYGCHLSHQSDNISFHCNIIDPKAFVNDNLVIGLNQRRNNDARNTPTARALIFEEG